MLPYPHPPQTHSFYQSQMQQPHVYAPYVQHQQSQHLDDYALAYGAAEYAEFGGYGQGAYYEDFDDVGGEVSTRPRLTKEQVEILESQFQANHKPSSTVKRQLAMQTMLSLPRVAVSLLEKSCEWILTIYRTGSRTDVPKLSSRRSRKSLRTAKLKKHQRSPPQNPHSPHQRSRQLLEFKLLPSAPQLDHHRHLCRLHHWSRTLFERADLPAMPQWIVYEHNSLNPPCRISHMLPAPSLSRYHGRLLSSTNDLHLLKHDLQCHSGLRSPS